MANEDPQSDVASERRRVTLVVADRIQQALARNPDKFRAGWGLNTDFAKTFGVQITQAKRILSGQAIPEPVVMIAIATELGLTLDWLYGVDDVTNIDHVLARRPIKFAVFDEVPGVTVDIPMRLLPNFEKNDRVISVRVMNDDAPGLDVSDVAFVRISSTPHIKSVCAFLYGTNLRAPQFGYLMRNPESTLYWVSNGSSNSKVFNADQVSFGASSPTEDGLLVIGPSSPSEDGLHVIGPVVGSMAFKCPPRLESPPPLKVLPPPPPPPPPPPTSARRGRK